MPTTSASLAPSHLTTGDAATAKSVKEVYRTPIETVPRSPSCSQGPGSPVQKGRKPSEISERGRCAYGVNGALEVLGGAVGGEDEEEGGGEDVHVGGMAPRRGRGQERRGCGGRLLVAAGVHGERLLEAAHEGRGARD